jgi:peptidoglycan LD-endopeptidase LytH
MRAQRNHTWLSEAGQTASKFSRHGTNFGSGMIGFWRGLWWRARHSSFASLKPGWLILIGLLGLYALWATFALIGAQRDLARIGTRSTTVANTTTRNNTGSVAASQTNPNTNNTQASSKTLLWPLEGASMPRGAANVPGAARSYRNGRSQGFTFTGGDSGVTVKYGLPVRAAAAGQILRSDLEYRESSESAYRALLRAVRRGATSSQLDALRGRQIWIKHSDGRVTRYGHLSKIAPGIGLGNVEPGQVIGYVGNSGTLEGARGTKSNARLQFEIWLSDSRFLGFGMTAAQVRAAANGVFK